MLRKLKSIYDYFGQLAATKASTVIALVLSYSEQPLRDLS